MNVKVGKFELDNLVSEKRMLFLSNNGGFYQVYHYTPFREAQFLASNPLSTQVSTAFGLGDNQLCVELSGHSENSYTRYSVALLSSNEGNPGLPNRTYDGWVSFNHGFQVGKVGVQRVGAFAYFGERPTFLNTSLGAPVLGEGIGNRWFYRPGLTVLFCIKKFAFNTVFVHGCDKVLLARVTAEIARLLVGPGPAT